MPDEVERRALETGARLGALETRVVYHDEQLKQVTNGVRDGANATGRLATEMAVQSVAIIKIQESLTREEALHTQKTSWSIQVWLAIFAFVGACLIALAGIVTTLILAFA